MIIDQTLWTAFFAGAAGFGFGLRANMMKPEVISWPDRPFWFRFGVFLMAAVLWAYTFKLLGLLGEPYAASDAEAVLMPVLAFYSAVVWLYFYRTTPNPLSNGHWPQKNVVTIQRRENNHVA